MQSTNFTPFCGNRIFITIFTRTGR